jgi:hypothetical protein
MKYMLLIISTGLQRIELLLRTTVRGKEIMDEVELQVHLGR